MSKRERLLVGVSALLSVLWMMGAFANEWHHVRGGSDYFDTLDFLFLMVPLVVYWGIYGICKFVEGGK